MQEKEKKKSKGLMHSFKGAAAGAIGAIACVELARQMNLSSDAAYSTTEYAAWSLIGGLMGAFVNAALIVPLRQFRKDLADNMREVLEIKENAVQTNDFISSLLEEFKIKISEQYKTSADAERLIKKVEETVSDFQKSHAEYVRRVSDLAGPTYEHFRKYRNLDYRHEGKGFDGYHELQEITSEHIQRQEEKLLKLKKLLQDNPSPPEFTGFFNSLYELVPAPTGPHLN